MEAAQAKKAAEVPVEETSKVEETKPER